MQLILMRHGEPARGGSNPLDPELRAEGLVQARHAVPSLRRMDVRAVFSSPQLRARQTAGVVGAGLAMEVAIDDGLVEFDHGAPYVHYDDASAPVWRSYLAGDLSPWGLTATAFKDRVAATMENIAAGSPPASTVLAVCHGGVINAWTCAVMGVGQRIQVFEPGYASLSRYTLETNGRWRVLSLNERAPAA